MKGKKLLIGLLLAFCGIGYGIYLNAFDWLPYPVIPSLLVVIIFSVTLLLWVENKNDVKHFRNKQKTNQKQLI